MADPLAFVDDELRALAADSLLREVRSLSSAPEPEVVLDGKRLVQFASNNYLGLATHPRVVEAAAEAARRWGVGAGAARLITGGLVIHDKLEHALAAFKGTEAALLFSSGYLANVGAIAALTDREDLIISDELNHASIIDGARLSRAHVHVAGHADVEHVADLLRAHPHARRRLVATDGVFSMDGDLAPLPGLVEACERHGAMLMVDEAHASGVVGPQGRGAVAHFGLAGRVPIVMGTLSKALGAAGGYIAGSASLIAFLRNRARSFVFDTALPPPIAAAASAALAVVLEEPEHVARVRALAERFAAGVGAPVPAAAIVPVVVGASEAALELASALREAGYLIPAIRPPTVPQGSARLRVTTMATHTEAHVDGLAEAIARLRVPA